MTSAHPPTTDRACHRGHRLPRLCGLALFLLLVVGADHPAPTTPGDPEGPPATLSVPDNATPEGHVHPGDALVPAGPAFASMPVGSRRDRLPPNTRNRHRADRARAPPRA